MENTLLLTMIERGGLIIYPLLLCSILALGIILDRFFLGLKREKIAPLAFIDRALELVANKKLESAEELCRTNDSSASRLAKALLTDINEKSTRESLEATLTAQGKKESALLNKNNNALGTIAAVSPLLGLLGTVFGMISTFDAIASESGLGNAEKLAGGISEALITTAVGLSIAIPALVMHRYFKEKARGFTEELENFSVSLLDKLS